MNRRDFIKACAGSFALAAIFFLPSNTQANDIINAQPSPGSRPLFSKEIICRDYIQDYEVGGTVKYSDLIDGQDCEKCTYEDACTCSGTRFSKPKSNFPRTHYPELYGKDLLNEFVK